MTARRLVGRLQRRQKKGWHVVLLDECHARLFPTRAPQWVKRGHYPVIPLHDRHGKCAVFGAADLHTGQVLHHLARSLSGAEQLQLLDQVVATYPAEHILLVWDNGPTHRNRRVTEWLAQHPQVVCFWLPPYSGADVNPVEHCWRWFRDHVTHNHLFETLEQFRERRTGAPGRVAGRRYRRPAPLRTGRARFRASGSSLSNAYCGTRPRTSTHGFSCSGGQSLR